VTDHGDQLRLGSVSGLGLFALLALGLYGLDKAVEVACY
jgi:hypothetical protein